MALVSNLVLNIYPSAIYFSKRNLKLWSRLAPDWRWVPNPKMCVCVFFISGASSDLPAMVGSYFTQGVTFDLKVDLNLELADFPNRNSLVLRLKEDPLKPRGCCHLKPKGQNGSSYIYTYRWLNFAGGTSLGTPGCSAPTLGSQQRKSRAFGVQDQHRAVVDHKVGGI